MRLTAFILIAGGLLGLGLGLASYSLLLRPASGTSWATAMTGLYLVIFGWCVWTGVDLWQGKPQGYKWAKVLFAAQIPVITFPGFTYHFEVGGLVIQFLLAPNPARINFHVGSSLSIYVSPAIQGVVLGANFVAIFALVCLMRVPSPRSARSKDKV